MDAIVGQIIFLDLHCRLGAWWLTHVWRAQQLAESSSSALHIWQIITAAACSRSLLEGAAAFSAETDAMMAEWDELKQMGVPTSDSISRFAAPLEKRISRGQFGTRLAESVDVKPPLQSTNVMTYVNKLAKQRPNENIKEIYEWLCDAVHPSFGGMTVFVANQGAHFSETHNLVRIAKNPLADKSYEPAYRADCGQRDCRCDHRRRR
ncbi:hypothetical protein AB0M95_13715 [Sphaerisporangium sp. NPDC051017]|uniref:hypothetical protein n=1 Tax=Sphaerisporangium sp. NPDC051017 TaxID=3154636 RepID=UPI00341FAF9B